jgi:hypothetical protein
VLVGLLVQQADFGTVPDVLAGWLVQQADIGTVPDVLAGLLVQKADIGTVPDVLVGWVVKQADIGTVPDVLAALLVQQADIGTVPGVLIGWLEKQADTKHAKARRYRPTLHSNNSEEARCTKVRSPVRILICKSVTGWSIAKTGWDIAGVIIRSACFWVRELEWQEWLENWSDTSG